MPSARRAIVLGGGIAGLSAAIALRAAGYEVAVHEQADAIAPLGAAISLWPNAVAALRRLGVAAAIEPRRHRWSRCCSRRRTAAR